jgi:hypothetical protein
MNFIYLPVLPSRSKSRKTNNECKNLLVQIRFERRTETLRTVDCVGRQLGMMSPINETRGGEIRGGHTRETP